MACVNCGNRWSKNLFGYNDCCLIPYGVNYDAVFLRPGIPLPRQKLAPAPAEWTDHIPLFICFQTIMMLILMMLFP